jgi:hypothetical protein
MLSVVARAAKSAATTTAAIRNPMALNLGIADHSR